MSVRSYFRTLFSKEAWRAMGGILIGISFTSIAARRRYWESVEREKDVSGKG